jgi:hypothetical protein
MNRSLPLSFLALALSLSLSIVPDSYANTGAPDPTPESNGNGREAADFVLMRNRVRPAFELSRVDKHVVRELEKAWWISSNGTNGKEGAVLIFESVNGSYTAKLQRKTNEQKKVSFTWVPNAIAIVHTHPNRSDPKPSLDDVKLADRLKVPMFTISLYGMWVYNPATKKTALIHQGLDWLDPEKWASRAEESKASADLWQSGPSKKESVTLGLSPD